MRSALIGLATVAAALAIDVQAPSAQQSFFNGPYCSQPGTGNDVGSAAPNCEFNTWEQCIASARGLGRYCTANPWWRGPRQQPTTQGKSRQHNRQ
jgi:hypothetical protein